MAQRKGFSGLIKRGEVWHIQKMVRGRRICESTGTGSLQEAEQYLVHRLEQLRHSEVYGIRPERTFLVAATRFIDESQKKTIRCDIVQIEMLRPFIGQLPISKVTMEGLKPFIKWRQGQGKKARTINYALQTVRHILNLCAMEWRDENGLTWLETAPKIKLLPEKDKREPYPISWEEQFRLLNELPEHLAKMVLFVVNTGLREQEICGLRWDWEVEVPEMDTSIFFLPNDTTKNGQERVLVLNTVAKRIVEDKRGEHPTHVFSYRGNPLKHMNVSGWKKARVRAGLPHVRVHDLRHTFGRRLRAAGVSFEDRQDLLGHKSGRVTTEYSMAELENLVASANKICGEHLRKSHALVVLRQKFRDSQAARN